MIGEPIANPELRVTTDQRTKIIRLYHILAKIAVIKPALIALFIFLLMPVAHSQHKYHLIKGQSAGGRMSLPESAQLPTINALPKQLEDSSTGHKKPCENPTSNQDYDTCSQWRSAEAAENALKIGHNQSKIEYLGILVGFFSALFTAIAAICAAIAAYEAKRSANIANESLVSLERAFVFCSGVELPQQRPKENQPYLIRLRFINVGRTPTKHAKVYWSWRHFDNEIPIDFKFPDVEEREPGDLFIGPSGLKILGPIEIPNTFIDNVCEGKGKIYIWAWVEYDDIFNDTPRHRTEFCVMLDFSHKDKPPTCLNHKKFNGADEECLNPIQTASPKNPMCVSI